MHEFAYVTFVNNNPQYIELMKTTILSVLQFSRFPLLLYCVNMSHISNIFPENERIIIKHIDTKLPNIYYYKPYVIMDCIENGVKKGYYIESDDVLTPFADDILFTKAQELTSIPISPIHPIDNNIPYKDMVIVDSLVKTQHYIHAHVLFVEENLDFIKEWLTECLKYNHYQNADETVLNLMYWKRKCINHYMEVIDPWYMNFDTNPEIRDKVCSFHGCKNPIEQYELFNKMIKYYKKN